MDAPRDHRRGPVPVWADFLHPARPAAHGPVGNGVDRAGPTLPPSLGGFPFGSPHQARGYADFATTSPWSRDERAHFHGRRGRRHEGRRRRDRRHRVGADASDDEAGSNDARNGDTKVDGREHAHEPSRPAGEEAREKDDEACKGNLDGKPAASPSATLTPDEDAPDPAEVAPDEGTGGTHPPHGSWPYGSRSYGCRGHGRCSRNAFRRDGCGPRGRCPPRQHPEWPFDFASMMRGLAGHPFLQTLRDQAQRYYAGSPAFRDAAGDRGGKEEADEDEDDIFSPPVDVFNTHVAYVLHVALPGARRQDTSVGWNAEAGTLDISGVVLRPGDDTFLDTLASAERRVGLFERHVALPPEGADNAEEVDAEHISAKMEDGILVIVVPKLEKEWTEIRTVDIE